MVVNVKTNPFCIPIFKVIILKKHKKSQYILTKKLKRRKIYAKSKKNNKKTN